MLAAPAPPPPVTVYPALAFAADVARVHARSGLAVLLPDRVRIPPYADPPFDFRALALAHRGGYELRLVNRACDAKAACRHPLTFTADRSRDTPSGDVALPRGRRGSYGTASCTGGGCTPSSITWIERGARYTLYANVSHRRLRAYVGQAIAAGPRRR